MGHVCFQHIGSLHLSQDELQFLVICTDFCSNNSRIHLLLWKIKKWKSGFRYSRLISTDKLERWVKRRYAILDYRTAKLSHPTVNSKAAIETCTLPSEFDHITYTKSNNQMLSYEWFARLAGLVGVFELERAWADCVTLTIPGSSRSTSRWPTVSDDIQWRSLLI